MAKKSSQCTKQFGGSLEEIRDNLKKQKTLKLFPSFEDAENESKQAERWR